MNRNVPDVSVVTRTGSPIELLSRTRARASAVPAAASTTRPVMTPVPLDGGANRRSRGGTGVCAPAMGVSSALKTMSGMIARGIDVLDTVTWRPVLTTYDFAPSSALRSQP